MNMPLILQRMLLSLLLCACQLGSATLNDPFDVREATIDGIHNALFTGLTTCREIVSAHLARIEAFNPAINAITALNTEALSVAEGIDLRISRGNTTGSLLCIPVLVKDNYDAVPMNTTGSCLALANNKPVEDAPTVKALKASGAIILGKTNLHELALEGLSVSSLGGQTVNPYDQTRTPGGSSGGSGAAVAANLAVFATGTDVSSFWIQSLPIQEQTYAIFSLCNEDFTDSLFEDRP